MADSKIKNLADATADAVVARLGDAVSKPVEDLVKEIAGLEHQVGVLAMRIAGLERAGTTQPAKGTTARARAAPAAAAAAAAPPAGDAPAAAGAMPPGLMAMNTMHWVKHAYANDAAFREQLVSEPSRAQRVQAALDLNADALLKKGPAGSDAYNKAAAGLLWKVLTKDEQGEYKAQLAALKQRMLAEGAAPPLDLEPPA